MGFVPAAPRPQRSYDNDRRSMRADIARIDRRRHAPAPKPGLVKVEPEAAEWWPTGTPWLDTSGDA
jgi:hypothetical protein